MQSTHDNSERLETSPDRGLIVLGTGTECDGYWSTRDKRCAKRECEREWVCVCVRKEETRERNRAPGYSANTANPVTLLQARTSPFTERCWERCVSKATHSSSSVTSLPLLLWLLRYWKHHGGHREQQVCSLVDFCLQAQAELKRNAEKRKAIRKEGIKGKGQTEELSSGGITVTTDVTT